MSTNIRTKKSCEHCGEIFIARTLVTRYCSHRCNARAYKVKQRDIKLAEATDTKKEIVFEPADNNPGISLVNIKQLTAILHVSERTLYRLIKEEGFPKIKIGTRLLFNKDEVIHFINHKYKSV